MKNNKLFVCLSDGKYSVANFQKKSKSYLKIKGSDFSSFSQEIGKVIKVGSILGERKFDPENPNKYRLDDLKDNVFTLSYEVAAVEKIAYLSKLTCSTISHKKRPKNEQDSLTLEATFDLTQDDYFGVDCRFLSTKTVHLWPSKYVFVGATSLVTNRHFMMGFSYSNRQFSLSFKVVLNHSPCSCIKLMGGSLVFLNDAGTITSILLCSIPTWLSSVHFMIDRDC